MHFTVAAYGISVYPPGATFGPRTHVDYEFVWIMNGRAVWEIDGNRFDAPPATLLLGRPGMRERYTWDPDRQTRHAFIHFQIHDRDPKLPPEKGWPRLRHLPEGDIARPLFRHLIWLLDERRGAWEPLLQGALSQLLLTFVHGAIHGKPEGRLQLPEPVEKALQYVQRQWAGGQLLTPSLDRLAKVAGVSDVHLCRLFRQALGHGPITVLRMLRLDRAAMLLSRSNLQIQEVATLTGFANPFHFTRSFKAHYGYSPRDYRNHLDSGATVLPRELLLLRRIAGEVNAE